MSFRDILELIQRWERMQHHFWDMDDTLIDNDCDLSWKAFLVSIGRVDDSELETARRFYKDYEQGQLDVKAFLEFQMRDFRGQTPDDMRELAIQHFEARVLPKVFSGARKLVREQRDAGDDLHMLTATNRVIAAPVAEAFGIPHLLATELAVEEGRFNGLIQGRYCLGEGKLARLTDYCATRNLGLCDVYYYGDSLSDLHVLRQVGHPVAVNPRPGLLEVARREGWQILDFRAFPAPPSASAQFAPWQC